MERHERELVAQQGLNQLDVDLLSVVVLVDQQDLDYQQAAEVLGIRLVTMKNRLALSRTQ